MKKYIPYIISTILLILLIYKCEENKDAERLSNANIDALTDTVKHYKNRLGTQTASIKTLQLEKNQLEKYVLEKDKELAALAKEFSDIKQVVKYETVTQIDTVFVAFDEPLDTFPTFERAGAVKEKWYSFNYKVNNNGFNLEKLSIPNEATVITGYKRKWFLGKQTLTTDITNSNPYIKVNDIKAAEVVIPEPWYKKWYVWAAAGLLCGIAIGK